MTLDCEMPNLSDTFRVIFAGFGSMVSNMASESTVLGLSDFTWSSAI